MRRFFFKDFSVKFSVGLFIFFFGDYVIVGLFLVVGRVGGL